MGLLERLSEPGFVGIHIVNRCLELHQQSWKVTGACGLQWLGCRRAFQRADEGLYGFDEGSPCSIALVPSAGVVCGICRRHGQHRHGFVRSVSIGIPSGREDLLCLSACQRIKRASTLVVSGVEKRVGPTCQDLPARAEAGFDAVVV